MMSFVLMSSSYILIGPRSTMEKQNFIVLLFRVKDIKRGKCGKRVGVTVTGFLGTKVVISVVM